MPSLDVKISLAGLEAELGIPRENFPVCDVCKRPVDRMERQMSGPQGAIIRAYCHGDVEEVLVSNEQLVEASAVTMGRAFVRKRLP